MLDGGLEILETKDVQFDERSVSSMESRTGNSITFECEGNAVTVDLTKSFLETRNRRDEALDESTIQKDAQGSNTLLAKN